MRLVHVGAGVSRRGAVTSHFAVEYETPMLIIALKGIRLKCFLSQELNDVEGREES